VRQDAEHGLSLLGCRLSRRDGRAEATLMAAEAALVVPPLVIESLRESLPHLAPVRRFGPPTTGIARIEVDDGLPHI